MKPRNLPLLVILLCIVMFSCNNEEQKTEATALSLENLIPKPVSVKPAEGSFEITSSTLLFAEDGSAESLRIGRYLADKLKPATGFDLRLGSAAGATNSISLALVNDSSLTGEGYELKITPTGISINANKPAGVFYAVQTLRQLLPPAIEMKSVQPGPWQIAAVTIRDYPDYAMRGSMLDVARHFFGVDDIKRYIDFLAYYKMKVWQDK